MCSCAVLAGAGGAHTQQVRCVGVPFGVLPDLPLGPLASIELINSGLERLDEDSFRGTRVETLRLMSNHITWIHPAALRSVAGSLISIDVSFNRLYSLPSEMFRAMSNVSFVNLRGNFLSELRPSDWRKMRHSLTQAFVGENELCKLEPGTFAGFRQLTTLNLDGNLLKELPADALPDTLHMLNVNNNLLTRLPTAALHKLRRLNWLYFQGNHITELPATSLGGARRLVELRLSHNLLTELPGRLFNGSTRVHDLHLQYNQLSALRRSAFAGLHLARLFLGYNRLTWVDADAFHGVGHSLTFLDLEGNQLMEVPPALRTLRKLRFLTLANNGLSEVPAGALIPFQDSLESLSLAENLLENVPAAALRGCSQLTSLNLDGNRLRNISDQDWVGWAGKLVHLLLRNNLLTWLPERTFQAAPNIRKLSLSFNRLRHFTSQSLADLASSLVNLEASFAVQGREFPYELVQPLASLRWLVMDNNGFRRIGDSALYTMPELEYVNLESNRLRSLPTALFHKDVHKKLSDVRLSYNEITRLERETFSGLEGLNTVVLMGNKISMVDNLAFSNLVRLITVTLDSNRISELGAPAFHGLPNLLQLDLQNNRLRDFSMKTFFNVTNEHMPLTLNLSSNEINALYPYPTGTPLFVKTLDLSHNRLIEVPTGFLQGVSVSLRHLDLSFNVIERLDGGAFSTLDKLQVLNLRGNAIRQLDEKSLEGVGAVQILDLSRNSIAQLPETLLRRLTALRHLTLAHNQLETLPQPLLQNAPLESLDLSGNRLRVLPSAALAAVGSSLARLDLSDNRLDQLDGIMFARLPRLSRLSLARNRLSVLPDTVFLSLPRLLSLDLSDNPLRTNYKELFHYLQQLQELRLASVGLEKAPDLPLPNLVHLNLSSNGMTQIPFGSFGMMRSLRVLDLSNNAFAEVPSKTWMHTPLLHTLHISGNPVQILNGDSFAGLDHLRDLGLGGLHQLIRFDTDTLLGMRELDTLRITTCPQIEKYRFRLGGVLNGLQSVRRLHVEVRENKLDDQLWGGFGPKLTELRLTGASLRQVDPEAFKGFQGHHELVLQLTDTSVSELPDDLLRHLRHVTALTLDLRRNRLINLSPSTLYRNGSDWETPGTQLVKGGIALSHNRWVCDCGLLWLGQWQRRWVRESLRIHTEVPRNAQHVQRLVRQATCTDLRTGAETPIMDLRAENLHCRIGATDAGGRPAGTGSLLLLPLLLSLPPLLRRDLLDVT
ncbi:chaoptin-like [Amphibalanus amphitrite]|uniref:chaoptin-like n=1 Tax=Amphibalanus amphitrite TaxID=1232801 RepID=UPI001C91A368|nr:chaoptin-like [Amphibalanus amphitrite]